jgi:hypothetical protein
VTSLSLGDHSGSHVDARYVTLPREGARCHGLPQGNGLCILIAASVRWGGGRSKYFCRRKARTSADRGGNTEFADVRAAYDALDERMKRLVEDLECHHSQINSREKSGFTELSDAEREAFKPVRQRLVRSDPVTGRKSLFLSSHAGNLVIRDNRVTMHRGRPIDASERRDIRQTRLGRASVAIGARAMLAMSFR